MNKCKNNKLEYERFRFLLDQLSRDCEEPNFEPTRVGREVAIENRKEYILEMMGFNRVSLEEIISELHELMKVSYYAGVYGTSGVDEGGHSTGMPRKTFEQSGAGVVLSRIIGMVDRYANKCNWGVDRGCK